MHLTWNKNIYNKVYLNTKMSWEAVQGRLYFAHDLRKLQIYWSDNGQWISESWFSEGESATDLLILCRVEKL